MGDPGLDRTDGARWQELQRLFDGALDLPPESRDTWLVAQCGGDEALLAEARALVAEESRRGGVLSRGAPASPAAYDPGALVGRTFGEYTIERLLAQGGMGVVYAARQEVPRRVVALKTLRGPHADTDALRRFRLEVEVLGLLQHPGIAQVYDGGTLELPTGPAPFLTMELVPEARDLVRHAAEQRLDLRARCRLLREVCEAVHEGHRRGIVHRDLKPANVLVGTSGRPKVIDFGLARVLDEGVLAVSRVETIAGRILGTLDYMSPEHVSGRAQDVDVRSDVFSLGCILFELCTGRTPRALAGLGFSQVVRVLEREPVVTPRGLPRPLRAILKTALAHDQAHRYGSALELAQDLARFEAGAPVLAQRGRLRHAISAFSRRHRALLAASAAVSLALAVGLWRANVARARASSEATTSYAISEFLVSMMRAIDAYRSGKDARIVDLLATGEQRVGAIADPRARAVSQSVLGEGYLSLGEIPRALELLKGAVDDLRGLLAPTDRALIHAEAALADALERSGDYEASLDLAQDALAWATAKGSLARTEVHYLRNNIAICLGRLGRFAEAEALHRESLADIERAVDPVPGGKAAIHERLADVLRAQHRDEEARAELQLALRSLAEDGAERTLFGTSLRMSVANMDLMEGRAEEALAGFLAAREQYIALGDSTNNVLAATLNLAQAYTSLARFPEAVAELDRARELCAIAEPGGGRQTHNLLITTARTRLVAKDFEAAAAIARDALRAGDALVPAGHPSEPVTRVILARAEAGAGRLDEALTVVREGAAKITRAQGAASRDRLRLLRAGVDVLVRGGRQADADAFARAALDELPSDVTADERAAWRSGFAEAGAQGLLAVDG